MWHGEVAFCEPARQRKSAFRQVIETCGKHPLVTGIFALLGVVGLLFSFFTFGLDQVQQREDRVDAEVMKSSLGSVEAAVKAVPAAAIEPVNFDPVASKDNTADPDNVAAEGASANRSFDDQRNSPTGFSNWWVQSFSVRSVAGSDYVQMAPYLVAEVVDVSPVPERMAAIYRGERGAASEARTFKLNLRARRGLQFAPLVDDQDRYRSDVDYFSLAPREPEELFLFTRYQPGFVFRYRIGIHYRYKGKDRLHWLTSLMRGGLPDRPVELAGFDPVEYAVAMHPDYSDALDGEVQAASDADTNIVTQGAVFAPRLLSAR